MARWRPNARNRLAEAAIDLFDEQGFAATTVPQIAERAGLTTRTFYRHYADKREVLFGPEHDPGAARAVLATIPSGLSTAGLIAWGLGLLADRFEPYREQMRATRALIASDPALQERALRKRAMLTDLVYTALCEHGLEAGRARLLAETTISAFYVAVDQWVTTDTDDRLDALALAALAEIGTDLGDIRAVTPMAARNSGTTASRWRSSRPDRSSDS